jgi:signal transduction histidine kinase
VRFFGSDSNACKFTPAGGKLTITTRLVVPAPPPPPPCAVTPTTATATSLHPPATDLRSLTATALSLHNEASEAGPVERIVVRIEVSDTGSGIPPKDMVECKLFCELPLLLLWMGD